jgi:hypothetical protein
MGSIATSMSMLFNVDEKALQSTKSFFVNGTYGCKFTVWRLFYEQDWKAEQAAAAKKKAEEEAAAAKRPDAKPKQQEKADPATSP